MSKIWRCSECETLNSGRKCIVCGYEFPDSKEQNEGKNQKPIEKQKHYEQNSLNSIDDNINKAKAHKNDIKTRYKPLIMAIAAVSAAVASILLGVSVFILKSNYPDKVVLPETEQTSAETVTSVIENSVSSAASVTEMSETTAEITSSAVTDEKKVINVQKLCSEIVSAVNDQRENDSISPLKYESKASEIADDILKDIVAGTYVKETYMNYAYGKYDHITLYYEEKVEFTSGINESEAAEMLLKNESENFSSNWLLAKYQYIGSAVYDYGDGTFGIVFTLCYNDEEQTAANEKVKIPDYSGLTADGYTAELKRLGLQYQIIMFETDSVSEGNVVSIDGGTVGEYYEGIHIITVYKAVKPVENVDYITIKGEEYSTELTELDLYRVIYWELENEDIKPLDKMVNLTSLSWWCCQISDISPLKDLKS